MNHPPDSNHIVHFFLDLYRLQVGLPEPDLRLMSAHALTDPQKSREITYELNVTHRGKGHSRRMSLCQLGDDAASKSTCYKIIYDDLLVLKIPPQPVVDFDRYLQNIEWERRISSQLAPEVACVNPSLGAILKKFPEFQNDNELSQTASEKIITRRLKESPDLQRYLKIRGTFVLFMNLSKHLFFDQVIGKMHQQGDQLSDTIAGSLDIMGDIQAFEATFGKGNDAIFFNFANLQNTSYLREMDRLLQQHGKDSHEVPEYRKRQWMFDQLAGKDIDNERDQLPEAFILNRKRIGARIFSREKKAIAQFFQLIRSEIRKTTDIRNRNIAGGIISNLMEMLFHLREKDTAIRDLKPDNMFLAGNSDNPDFFLTSADQYALGLIDLETSVNFDKTKALEQPILAGTPFFATPSHLFENRYLAEVFHDVPKTLYLQDWFAAVGIIYNVVTGKTLFEKTGQLLPEVFRVRSKAIAKGEPPADVLKHAGWAFWHTACAEFRKAMVTNQAIFKSIFLSLGEREKEMLLAETLGAECLLLNQIKRSILNQSFFKGDQVRKNMVMASAEKIADLEKNWPTGKDAQKASPELNSEIMAFLRCLAHLKKSRATVLQLRPLFEKESSSMTAQHLVFQLFRLVFFFMYRPEWTPRKHPEPV